MKTSFAIDDFHSWDMVVGTAHFSSLLHGKVKREVRRARQMSKTVTKNYKVLLKVELQCQNFHFPSVTGVENLKSMHFALKKGGSVQISPCEFCCLLPVRLAYTSSSILRATLSLSSIPSEVGEVLTKCRLLQVQVLIPHTTIPRVHLRSTSMKLCPTENFHGGILNTVLTSTLREKVLFFLAPAIQSIQAVSHVCRIWSWGGEVVITGRVPGGKVTILHLGIG